MHLSHQNKQENKRTNKQSVQSEYMKPGYMFDKGNSNASGAIPHTEK